MVSKFSPSLCCLPLLLASLASHSGLAQVPETAPSPARRVKVSDDVASSLVLQKARLVYPDAARKAGIQGTVVLKVVTSGTGEVKEVTVVSGDPLLGQAAADAVKQWKYKPYTVDNVPVEMETQVSIKFQFKSAEHAAPPLGSFKDGMYLNELLDILYPLSRDWVRETQVMRKKLSMEPGLPGISVLLAAVHIPQQTAPLEADSSFVLSAFPAEESCDNHLQNIANSLHSRKEAQQKGIVSELTLAGREFRRADFDSRQSTNHLSIFCTKANDYLLQWYIVGLSKSAVEAAASTLNSIEHKQSAPIETPAPTSVASHPANDADLKQAPSPGPTQVARVRVSQVLIQGQRIKDVAPIYPAQARYAHIQGSVVMSARIGKNGDVLDLEVLDGPIELVVSGVNAVRQWKYRPYLLKGEPVEVDTR